MKRANYETGQRENSLLRYIAHINKGANPGNHANTIQIIDKIDNRIQN